MGNTQAPPPTPIKRIGVRSLKSIDDCKVLQAKLLKAFLRGDIDEATAKVATYMTAQLVNCIKVERDINPKAREGEELVTTIVIGSSSTKSIAERQAAIDKMNSTILEPPEL